SCCAVLPSNALGNSQPVPPDKARHPVADLLGFGRFCRDVAGSVETRRPHLPGCAAALLAARRADRRLSNKKTDKRALQWSAAALIFSVVFTGSYSVAKMLSNYRYHADHLKVFSCAVNQQAVAHHWR